MEEHQNYCWLANLPNEILIEILDKLNRFQLNSMVRVNKRINGLTQYILEHRKKIRLCGDHLRVLVLTLPTKYDVRTIASSRFPPITGKVDVSRTCLVLNTFSSERPTTKLRDFRFREQRERRNCMMFKNGGKERKITFIEPPRIYERLRKNLYTVAVEADMLLLIVDPNEVDTHAEELKEMIFGCSFMMSARNVIVAVDLSNVVDEDASKLNGRFNFVIVVFNQTRLKMAKMLNTTVGMCYKIIPINVRTGCNIAKSPNLPNYEWFSNGSLKQLIFEDQLRTNFDEVAFNKLREAPFRFQLNRAIRIYGIGVVFIGRVASGTLKPGCEIKALPLGETASVKSIQSNHDDVTEAQPGDVIAIAVAGIIRTNVFSRWGTLVDKNTTPMMNVAIAFRAQFALIKPGLFEQHHEYTMFYGPARVTCIVLWIFPGEDGKSRDKAEYQYKYPKEPSKHASAEKWKAYNSTVEKLKEQFNGEKYKRPPKLKLKKATAIVFPLIPFEIEPYQANSFEKNYTGKLMVMGGYKKVVAVGRVDRVISNPAETFNIPTKADYAQQYQEVIDRAEMLFKLPNEQKLYTSFVKHVQSNERAQRCVHKRAPLSEHRAQ